MMFLVWLGSFILFIYSASQVQLLIQKLAGPLRSKWMVALQAKETFRPILAGVFLTVTSPSSFHQEASALQLYNLRILNKRSALLWLCLGSLGFAVPFFLSFFYLKVNGLMISGLILTTWLVLGGFHRKVFDSKILKLLVWIGLFYFFAENLLRQNSVFQTVLGTQELAFLFVDRRGPALAALFAMGFIKSFFIPLSGWSFWFSLALVPLGSLSLPSALCLMAGELFFSGILHVWNFRKTNSETVKAARHFAVVQSIGVLVGLVVTLIVIDFFQLGGFAAGDLHGLVLQLVLSFSGLLFFRFLAVMLWGHFASAKQDQEMQEPQYQMVLTTPRFFNQESIFLASEGLKKRLAEIKYYQMGLEQNQKQVPEALRLRVEKELLSLDAILQKLR